MVQVVGFRFRPKRGVVLLAFGFFLVGMRFRWVKGRAGESGRGRLNRPRQVKVSQASSCPGGQVRPGQNQGLSKSTCLHTHALLSGSVPRPSRGQRPSTVLPGEARVHNCSKANLDRAGGTRRTLGVGSVQDLNGVRIGWICWCEG